MSEIISLLKIRNILALLKIRNIFALKMRFTDDAKNQRNSLQGATNSNKPKSVIKVSCNFIIQHGNISLLNITCVLILQIYKVSKSF